MEERGVHGSISDINSEDITRNDLLQIPRKKRICLVGAASDDPSLGTAAQQFSVPVLKSQTGLEYLDDTTYCTYFVLKRFDGPEYESLHKSPHRLLGPTALLQLAEKRETLPSVTRPMYTQAMLGNVVAFTGFRKKEELTKLIDIIHHMGGSIRKEIRSKVTHLIANCCSGNKYRYAVSFRIPVMSVNWVTALWEAKDDVNCYSTSEDFISAYKLKPFYGTRVCFFGFPEEEKKHMYEVLQQQGGEPTEFDDPNCTHVVMDSRKLSNRMIKSLSMPLFVNEPSLLPVRWPSLSLIPSESALMGSRGRSLSLSEDLPRTLSFESTYFSDCADSGINLSFSFLNSASDSLMSIVELETDRLSVACSIQGSEFGSVFDMNESPLRRYSVTELVKPGRKSKLSKRHSIGGLVPEWTPDGASNKRRFLRSFKLKGSFFSKLSDISLPTSLKGLMTSPRWRTNSTSSSHEQSYTPLYMSDSLSSSSSSLAVPAKIAKFSNQPVPEITLDQIPRLVVDTSNVNSQPDLASGGAYIVKAEWFWTSVQNEGAADEKEYLFEDYLETVTSPPPSARRDSSQALTPGSTSTRRKRKRLAETLTSLVQNDSPAQNKRRSSVSDAGHLSVSGSFLDCTASPDSKQLLDDIPEVEAVNADSSRKTLSRRHQVFLELVQTETNYVNILKTIMTVYKQPLEEDVDKPKELLSSLEIKIIFGNFPPIYEVHKNMLDELRYAAVNWTEETSIGKIFLKYAQDLIKAYPSYINFFEKTKEMLDLCDQKKPRFHAFLKLGLSKPECGRQSLKELLIKPVQRLPSILLLLNDILKHTNKNNPDHGALELSISSIKEVMTHINEDKRKTEGQVVMFDIFNEIDNCPPHLVSSHRSFILKCDVTEMYDGLSGRGDHLVLFLFTDTLEICKKRSKAFNSLKSPNMTNGLHSVKLNQGKPYKHIKMLSLSAVKKVVDVPETEDSHNMFALIVRSSQELKEKLYLFTITDEDVNKTNYLRTLCRQMAINVCKPDADSFLMSLDPQQLEIDSSDVTLGTLSKAFKFASRTRMKVGRAFSFNKTPSKLKRAMSTMMSPFGSTQSLTPASQLAQMRLASCQNINELGNGGSGSPSRDNVLVAPMSVQPTRKAKCSTISVASLRRNCSDDAMKEKPDT